MAARRTSLIFVSAQYLKKLLSNYFDILQDYWYILDEGQARFWSQSEIQYSRQEAILDFCFRSTSQEVFELSTGYFADLLVPIR